MSKHKLFYGSNKVWITITRFSNSSNYNSYYLKVAGCATLGESYQKVQGPEKTSAKKTLLSLVEGKKFNKTLEKHVFSTCAHESTDCKISKINEIKEELISVLS